MLISFKTLQIPGEYVHGQPGRLLIKCSVIRKYDLTVGRGTAAPDGYLKNSLLINGQFPGPLLEANWQGPQEIQTGGHF